MSESPQKHTKLKLIYDFIFCALAFVAVYLALCDLTTGCNDLQIRLDNAITIIFIADYAIRLVISKDKKTFFKQNILDLIAIIPFNSLFKIFRILKILKVLKVLKIFKFARLSAYLGRLYKRVKFFFEINGLKYMVFVCLVCIVVGGITIHFVEDMSIFDGIWWSFVTATTVGYGDISPATPAGRIVAAVLMIVGIGLIGSLTSTITALFFQRHENVQKNTAKDEILKTIHEQLDDFDHLTDEDITTICHTLHSLHTQK